MRIAFKEWASVVDALGSGIQIVILRKGGISEGCGGFQIDYPRFLLYPTGFHQQRDSITPSAQARFDDLKAPAADKIRIEYFAEVVDARRLESLADAEALRGQHIWRDEVIADRFEWAREKAIYALAVRVFRLPQAVVLPMHAEYGGCKSWIELREGVPTDGAKPVLSDEAFEHMLNQFRVALAKRVLVLQEDAK